MTHNYKIVSHTVHGREILACLPAGDSAGAAAKTPLVFIHGAFAGAWMWAENFMPAFARAGYPCYALSLRGHGDSAEGERLDQLTISDYVEDVQVLVDWLGQAPVLIGHSMGGFVIQKYLEQYHAVAAGAALLCAVPPQGLVASQLYLMFQRPGILFELGKIMSGRDDVSLETLRDALFGQPVSDALLEEFRRRMQKESQRALWDMSLFGLPLTLMLRQRPPMLVLGTERDMLVPAFMVQVTAQTYGVPAHIFKEMGHALTHEQDWPLVVEKILSWLKEKGF